MEGTDPRALYLFSIGGGNQQLLCLGWQNGLLLGPFRTIAQARALGLPIVCGPEMAAQARAAGIPCARLPPGAREARGMFAAYLVLGSMLRGRPDREGLRGLLDAAAEIDRVWSPAKPNFGVRVRLGRRDYVVEVTGSRHCLGLVIRDGGTDGRPRFVVPFERQHPFAMEPLVDAGWPVLPLPMKAHVKGFKPLSRADVETVIRVMRGASLAIRPRIAEVGGALAC